MKIQILARPVPPPELRLPWDLNVKSRARPDLGIDRT